MSMMGLGLPICAAPTCCCYSQPPMDKSAPARPWGGYLGSNHVLRILLFAGCRVEYDVVNGLYQLQLNHALDEQAGQQFLIYIR